MITSLFALVAIASGMQASASTKYEVLKSWFDDGHVTRVEDFKGWYSGRCYFEDAQDKAVGTLLATEERQIDNTDGPFFGTTKTKLTFIGRGYQEREAPADYYDNPSDDLRGEIGAIFSERFSDELHSVLRRDGYTVNAENLRAGLAYYVNMRDDYMFGRIIDLNRHRSAAYCYFFKRIR